MLTEAGTVSDIDGYRKAHPLESISDMILAARFRCRLTPITIMQCYARTDDSDIVEKDTSYEQLLAVQKILPL